MPATSRTTATIALLIMTFLWGWTFVWIKSALDVADARLGGDALTLTVGIFMSIRFLGAAILLPIVLPPARRHLRDKAVWRAGGG